MRLSEAVEIKPSERERLGLPSYLSNILPKVQTNANSDLPPIEPKIVKWHIVDVDGVNRLTRTFAFEDARIKASFLLELIDYEEQIQHHSKVTMHENRVKIEIWTKGIDDVTEIDIEYSEEIDSIVDDVYYHFRNGA